MLECKGRVFVWAGYSRSAGYGGGTKGKMVYFPGNEKWTAASGKEEYSGGTSVMVDAPVDKIPVFIRNGAKIEFDL